MRLPTVNHQLLYLFGVNFVILFVGMGLQPVMPLYASDLGGSTTMVGVYLALTSASITLGTLVFGWVAVRFPHRRILAAAGLLGIPSLALMGQADSLWQLALFTGIVWFVGGIGLSLVSVLTGMIADKAHRGSSFSHMALSMPLASLAGGTVVGELIALEGYSVMFLGLAAAWLYIPFAAWRLEDCELVGRRGRKGGVETTQHTMSANFYAFALIALLSTIASNIARFGTSLAMRDLGFSPSEVASTATVSGLATIPVVLLISPLSDRVARRHVLAFTYSLVVIGILLLIVAGDLWHFWLASTLVLVGRVVSTALGAALITDFLRPEELIRGLARLNTVNWSSGIATFAVGGFLLNRLGLDPVFGIAATSAAMAAVQLEVIGRRFSPQEVVRGVVEDVKRVTQSVRPIKVDTQSKH